METQEKTPKSMTNEELIGACVTLDREQKKSRAMLNGYKAELQARGLALMEDHNVKYVKFCLVLNPFQFRSFTQCDITFSQSAHLLHAAASISSILDISSMYFLPLRSPTKILWMYCLLHPSKAASSTCVIPLSMSLFLTFFPKGVSFCCFVFIRSPHITGSLI